MRWIVFIPLAYLAVVVQTSLGEVLRVWVDWLGAYLTVDFLAALSVVIALRVRAGLDAVLAAWVLGLAADLTTSGSPMGLYALWFGLAAALIYQVRQAVFGEHPLSQVIVGLLFVLVADGGAVLFQNLYVRAQAGQLGHDLWQAVVRAVCTALATPLVAQVMRPTHRWVMVQPVGRR